MMKSASARYLELIERRLELIRALVRIAPEWRTAFIGLQMEESERCAMEEELLCKQIRALDRQIAALDPNQSKPPASIPNGTGICPPKMFEADPVVYPRIIFAFKQMASLQLELKHSNETRSAILKRSRFTMNALRNLFNSYAPLYSAPAAASTGTIYEESV